jgi:hypothetical protein
MTFKIYYIDQSGKLDYKLMIAYNMLLAIEDFCEEFKVNYDKINAVILVD